jgi:hypothetical protein
VSGGGQVIVYGEVFLISNFHRVLNIVYVLLGISPASDCVLPTFETLCQVHLQRGNTQMKIYDIQNMAKV